MATGICFSSPPISGLASSMANWRCATRSRARKPPDAAVRAALAITCIITVKRPGALVEAVLPLLCSLCDCLRFTLRAHDHDRRVATGLLLGRLKAHR